MTITRRPPRLRRAAIALLAVACLTVGCRSGATTVTHISVQRSATPFAKAATGPVQALKINLFTGEALLTETNGDEYPARVSAEVSDRLRGLLSTYDWDDAHLPKASKTGLTWYDMVIFDDKVRVGHVRWASGPDVRQPASINLVDDTFDMINRMANPLADRVNLIE